MLLAVIELNHTTTSGECHVLIQYDYYFMSIHDVYVYEYAHVFMLLPMVCYFNKH